MVNPIFYIQNMRSKEIKNKALELNFMRQAIIESPRKPVTNYHRITAKWQPLLNDYHKLINEYNKQSEVICFMMEVIITLLYSVDYSTNPNTNDEIFSSLSKEVRSVKK